MKKKRMHHQTLCTTHRLGVWRDWWRNVERRNQSVGVKLYKKQRDSNAANLDIKIASAELALDRTLFEFVSYAALKLRCEVWLRPNSCSKTQECRRCQSITAPYVPTQSWEEDESSKASGHLCWCVSSAKGGKKEEEKNLPKSSVRGSCDSPSSNATS